MSKIAPNSRRDFLKTTAAGSAGLILTNGIVNTVLSAEQNSAGLGIEINPKINNLRVVYAEDPAMLVNGTSTTFGTFSAATGKINAAVVKTNMDKMACALANEADVSKAWGIIFQKPSTKAWGDVTIAIKPNCAGGSNAQSYPHASVPIIKAVCDVLIGFGAKGSNITIYDVSGFSCNPSTLYSSANIAVGIKFVGPGSGTYTDPTNLVTTNVVKNADIIVNIASCKGHGQVGGTTLTMKNHIGTMKFNCPSGVQQLIDMHNSEALLGKPVAGSIPPKQQLCIIDCLWTAKNGPTSAPDLAPCMIVMGALSPAVDCFTAIKLRLEKFKYSGTRSTFISYLTLYGYNGTTVVEPLLASPTPAPDAQGRGWIDALKWTSTNIGQQNSFKEQSEVISFTVASPVFKTVTQKLSIEKSETIRDISILDIKGRIIQKLPINGLNTSRISWNGSNNSGRVVSAGTYFLKISGKTTEKTVRFTLQK